MIRLIQRRLIIPRGDTGTFTVPVISAKNTGDVAVFSIIDNLTERKVFEKIVEVSGDTMTIEFSHNDTVNLPVGKYVWDIKFYSNPVFVDGALVDGVEVDSYYAAFTLPICEIRQTGDNLLMADDAPDTELTPSQLNILNATVNETNAAKIDAAASASAAEASATAAAGSASEALISAGSAAASATDAATTKGQIDVLAAQVAADATTAVNAKNDAVASATSASTSATSADASATIASNAATTATNKANEAYTSAGLAETAKVNAQSAASAASTSAASAQAAANEIKNISAEATTLQPDSNATATYNSSTGKLTFGIPRGNGITSAVMNNDYTLTLTYTNGNTFTTPPLKGEQGDAFHIVKTYNSIAAMNADYSGNDVEVGEFVMIASTVEDPDNAKVYVKGDQQYNFVIDMSGASGIQGEPGTTPSFSIGNVNTLTENESATVSISGTNEYPVLNFGIPRGQIGSEYTIMVQNNQPTQSSNKLWIQPNQGIIQQIPTIEDMYQTIQNSRVSSLTNTTIASGIIIEVIGQPIYLSTEELINYSNYNLVDSGWYIFVRIQSKDNTLVSSQTSITGDAGHILTIGAGYVDLAIHFSAEAFSQKVIIDWGSYIDTFIFKASDLAIRNLDYRTTFYLYDLSPFITWQYVLTTDTTFSADKAYYVLNNDIYTLENITVGETVPENTYYQHSKVIIDGMTRNITYKLDEIVDCPIEIILPEVEDNSYGTWFEFQMRYNGSYSCTLTPPNANVKVGTTQTQSQTAGINIIDLQYSNVGGAKLWTLLNTHSNIPT